jgi:methylglutamate dehydrogenase subunit D
VAEDATAFASALDGVVAAGRHGRRTGDAGVIAREVRQVGLASVTAHKGRRAALIDAARRAFGVELADVPRRATGRDMTFIWAFIWAGPDQWLAHAAPAPAEGMEARLAKAFAGMAAIVDQSHGRTLLRVTGSGVRDALAKGLAIDLHPRAFKPGYTAITTVAHIGVHLWQIDEAPTYEIAVPRSLALSFWRWLEASAAEYGLELVGTG